MIFLFAILTCKRLRKLITIYGLSGIGKTALVLKLISEIQTEFDYIIYKSLDYLPQLVTLKDELKTFFAQSESNPLPKLIDYLRAFRCFVILDDVQNIFKSGELSGQYLPEYKDYSKFFQQIADNHHKSCVILISWEELKEKINTKTIHIKGLGEDGKKILREKELKDEESWHELIALYQSHPSWLNSIADTINQFYNGRVNQFLTTENELFLDDIERFLESHLECLSELETKVMHWLANEDEIIYISQRMPNIKLSHYKFLAIIRSLLRRCLVEKVQKEKGVIFQLNPIFKAHIKSKINKFNRT